MLFPQLSLLYTFMPPIEAHAVGSKLSYAEWQCQWHAFYTADSYTTEPCDAGIGAAGAIALVGDLPATVDAFKASYPLLVYPAKAVITWPLFYHYLGGVRHIIWEKHSMGKQAEKKSYLENEAVDKSSKLIFATSIVGTIGLTVLQL